MSFDLERARRVLVDRGYHEAITYSFVSPEVQALFDPDGAALALANPLSAELSVMRTGLWPGLVQAAQQNLSRQQARVRLFESGLRFREADGSLHQDAMLGGLIVGPVLPEQWGDAERPADFFDIKGDVEAILRGNGADYGFVPAPHPALHPGHSARIERAGRPVGWIGTLHPALARQLDLPAETQLFELATAALGDAPKPAFEPLSRFPSIRRDLAILVTADVRWEQVRACVEAAAGDLLKALVLFDVYQGQNIEPDRKSMALGLILQASSQTLTDQEVELLMARVMARLGDDLGARLRD
jgi:phenylalanyl-tRNA synthetase beta chain